MSQNAVQRMGENLKRSPSPETVRAADDLDTGDRPAPHGPQTDAGSVFGSVPPPAPEAEEHGQPTEEEIRLRQRVLSVAMVISQNYPVRVRTFVRNIARGLPGPVPARIHPIELVSQFRWVNSRQQLALDPHRMCSLERIRRTPDLPIFWQTSPDFILPAILGDLDMAFFGGALRKMVCIVDDIYPGYSWGAYPPGMFARRASISVDRYVGTGGSPRRRIKKVIAPALRALSVVLLGEYCGWELAEPSDDPGQPIYSVYTSVQMALNIAGINITMTRPPFMW